MSEKLDKAMVLNGLGELEERMLQHFDEELHDLMYSIQQGFYDFKTPKQREREEKKFNAALAKQRKKHGIDFTGICGGLGLGNLIQEGDLIDDGRELK